MREAVLTRAEVFEAASSKLIEAALLLLVAGEDHLATEVEEIMGRVDSTSALVPLLEEPVYPPLSLSGKCTCDALQSDVGVVGAASVSTLPHRLPRWLRSPSRPQLPNASSSAPR